MEAVNSPLKGSIQTAAQKAAGSGPQTATTFCRLLRRFPPPPRREQQCSREFLPVGSRHLAHYALVNAVASWGGGGDIHPLVPVTHAMWAAGRNVVTARRKKSLWACIRRKSQLRFGCRDPYSRMWHHPAASLDCCVWAGTTGSCAVTKVAAGWIHQKIGGARSELRLLLRVCDWVHVPRERESISARGCTMAAKYSLFTFTDC